MSDTPRTDAVVAAFPKTLPLGGTYSDMAEDARDWAIEHARTLERELAAAQAKIRGQDEYLAEDDAIKKDLTAQATRYMAERDEARLYAGVLQAALKPFAEIAEIELRRWGAGLPDVDVYANTHQVTVKMLVAARDALAKNPNPSGQLPTEASLSNSGEASGPVGLGPRMALDWHHVQTTAFMLGEACEEDCPGSEDVFNALVELIRRSGRDYDPTQPPKQGSE